MPSIWANFDHVFDVLQGLFFALLLLQKDALETRLMKEVHARNTYYRRMQLVFHINFWFWSETTNMLKKNVDKIF